nr:polysaccharide deacetylase [Rhodococcus rhodnii]
MAGALVGVCALVLSGCALSESGAEPTPAHIVETLEAVVPVEPERRASNVEFRRLGPDETPPQFVLFSFDGVGLTPNWDRFLEVADAVDARFTALMTGLYFVADENRKAYQGPRRAPGESAIAFGGSREAVLSQVEQLNRTWFAGHEMGTHYVGHFCDGSGYSGNQWTTADWNHELDEFFRLMTTWKEINGLPGAIDLAFGPEAVTGGRTQCLEGSPPQLFPALHAHGMTWDSSMPAPEPGLVWPEKIDGIWEFGIPYVYSPAFGKRQTALDYNFWVTFNGGKDQPETAPRARQMVADTYRHMYREAFDGNRAPIVVANHFNDWNGNAFNPATADFMADVCGRAETVCATHADVAAWMDLQDPAVLDRWRAMPAAAAHAPD